MKTINTCVAEIHGNQAFDASRTRGSAMAFEIVNKTTTKKGVVGWFNHRNIVHAHQTNSPVLEPTFVSHWKNDGKLFVLIVLRILTWLGSATTCTIARMVMTKPIALKPTTHTNLEAGTTSIKLTSAISPNKLQNHQLDDRRRTLTRMITTTE